MSTPSSTADLGAYCRAVEDAPCKPAASDTSVSDLVPLTMDELQEITQHLLRFAPDALIVIDDANRIRFANDTVRDLFGHGAEMRGGKPLEILIPERLRAHHGKHTASYMRDPNNREMGARIADLFALRADGSEFAAGIRLAPFRISGRVFVAAAIR